MRTWALDGAAAFNTGSVHPTGCMGSQCIRLAALTEHPPLPPPAPPTGRTYPLEMHIISNLSQTPGMAGCPAAGHLAATAVLFEVAAAGEVTNSTAELGKLPLDAVLPNGVSGEHANVGRHAGSIT